MTDADWQVCDDSREMLRYLEEQGGSNRQFRLFSCACCRRIWDRFPHPRNQRLIEAVEKFPDGTFDDPVIHDAAVASSSVEHQCSDQQAYWVAKYLGRGFYKLSASQAAMVVVQKILLVVGDLERWPNAYELEQGYNRWAIPQPTLALSRFGPQVQAEGGHQASLLRDVFGHLRSELRSLQPEWRTWSDGLVVHLAQAAADHRDLPAGTLDPERLAILADALEDAGCEDDEMLGHLRGPGPHVWGCWVLDRILG